MVWVLTVPQYETAFSFWNYIRYMFYMLNFKYILMLVNLKGALAIIAKINYEEKNYFTFILWVIINV